MRSSTQRSFSALALALVLGQAIAAPNHPGSSCSAQSPATMVPLVELYTSEGCSSCPPADRWLSRLKENPAVVALAFHVDYWDKLGWKDRFASPAYSRRQAQQQAFNGARFSYTPQVVLNGRDHPHWNATAIPASSSARSPATVTLTLSRSSDESSPPFTLTPAHQPGSPPTGPSPRTDISPSSSPAKTEGKTFGMILWCASWWRFPNGKSGVAHHARSGSDRHLRNAPDIRATSISSSWTRSPASHCRRSGWTADRTTELPAAGYR